METPKTFKAVPFNPKWIDHDKIDVRAIYRRPVRDARGRAVLKDGVPQWDLTGGLPVRRHHDWVKKGFEYVTLASGEDLVKAGVVGPRDFIMDEFEMSPWNPEMYLAMAHVVERQRTDALAEMVEQFGSDAVLAIRRADNPTFTLPEHLQGIPAGGKVKPVTEDAPAGEVASAPVAAKTKTPPKKSPAGRSAKKSTLAERAAAQEPSL